jgi:hypothetical protein
MKRLHFIQQMARPVLGILIFVITMLNANRVYAEDPDNLAQFGTIFKFSAGIISAFMIHEGAHFLAGEITGTDMEWELGNYNQPLAFTEEAKNDTDGLIVNSAGLVSQVIGSEIILQVDGINKNDAFVRGMMTWNILNPIFYALDYWFIRKTNSKNGDRYQGDIQGIEYYSSESAANLFAASMVAIAGIQGYRFLKTQDWAPDWLKDEDHRLNFAPVQSGGCLFKYTVNF